MAQDSIAYGESLLADVRSRNAKEQKRAESRAKKDFWKSAAVKIGLNVAENYMKERQTTFLNNEAAVANKIEMTTGNDYANSVIKEHELAAAYKGGVNGYVMDNLKNEIDFEYGKKFAKGDRSESDYSAFLNSQAEELFDGRLKGYNDKLAATQKHLAEGNLKLYNTSMNKLAGDGTLTGGVAAAIGKLTGNANADLHNKQVKDALARTKAYQETYNSTWKQTRNAQLSKAIAVEMPADGGLPAPQISTPVQITSENLLGEKITSFVSQVVQQTRNAEGNLVPKYSMMKLGGKGWEPYTSEAQNNNLDLSSIAGAISEKQLAAGKVRWQNMPGEGVKTPLIEAFNKQIAAGNNGLGPKDAGHAAFLLAKQEAFIRQAEAAGIQAAREGWGTAQSGRQIYTQAVLDRLENTGGVSDIGQLNIFDTMFAIQKLTTGSSPLGKLQNGNVSLEQLANKPKEMYVALSNMSTGNRDKLLKRLSESEENGVDGGVNYFKGNIENEDFANYIDGFKNVFQNKTKYNMDNFKSVDAMLKNSIQELKDRTPEEVEALSVEERRQQRMEALNKSLQKSYR